MLTVTDWGREFSASQAWGQLAASAAHHGIFCGNLLEKLGRLTGQRRHRTLETILGYKGHVGDPIGQYFIGEQVEEVGWQGAGRKSWLRGQASSESSS